MGYCDAFTITRQQRLRFAHYSHLWLVLWHHCLKRSDLISVNHKRVSRQYRKGKSAKGNTKMKNAACTRRFEI